ncbi:MAG TPA: TIGR03767 family metallophosphoesterase [Egibacteraceae bacterium]|nr:TIGR03767 family metallophosphoesterase [Egibacteraceae bacterium]
MAMSRRRFLGLVGAVAAATGLPDGAVAETLMGRGDTARAAANLTTLAQTLRPGGARNDRGYRPVVAAGGEPHLVRDEITPPREGRGGRRRSVLALVHLTDQHVIDTQSPSRVEFLDRLSEDACDRTPFTSAHRPHEAANARVADAMVRQIRRIGVSPVTGAPLGAIVCTGDNTDNMQSNELDVFLGVMDGGPVAPQSGHPSRYEGVQASGDPAYWHPDPVVRDRYKSAFGFPDVPGFLERSLAAFDAVGAGTPWFSCYGNHDGLAQGNVAPNPPMEAIGTGPVKVIGTPPGANPCTMLDGLEALPAFPGAAPGATVQPVTPDAERRYVDRREWVRRHLDSPGLPAGHGFTPANVEANTAYYTRDVGGVRLVVLDTVNPGGEASGSIGASQLAWLEERLAEADRQQRLVVLLSHHGLRSLSNPLQAPDPLAGPDGNDLPRHTAAGVEPLVAGHPSVVAWVNGHTHVNMIERRGQFWDIGTAAHIDWPAQARLIDLVDNRDGTLSIFTTMVDHEADDITAQARELCANDPQKGFGTGEGLAGDRNTELLLAHPFPAASPPAQPTTAAPAPGGSGPPADPRPSPVLPATGLPSGLTIGGALMVAGAIGVRNLHRRALGSSQQG